MAEKRTIREINIAIQEMLSSKEGLKKYYRFVANNPHLSLRDVCQIVTYKEDISICHRYQEWEKMHFKVMEDKKSIPYFDENGNETYVFDIKDTQGKLKYEKATMPSSRLLHGLSILTHKGIKQETTETGFEQIKDYVQHYLENEVIEERTLVIEGISYLLFCKTEKSDIKIELQGLPFSLKENALLFKNIHQQANNLYKEIDLILEQEENKNETNPMNFREYDEIVFDDIFVNSIKYIASKEIETSKLAEFEQNFENRYQSLTKKEKILLELSKDMGMWFDEFSEKEVREAYDKIIEKLCGTTQEIKNFDIEEIEPPPIKEERKKGIQERKKKEITLFDLLDEKEDQKESFIKSQLLRGSMIEGGKKRIYEEYLTNPTITEFAKFLKEEYGIGGSHSSDGDFWNDAKGIRMTDLKNSPNEEIFLNWKEVALRIADLIDDKEYYIPPTKEEKIEQIVKSLIKEGTENSNNGSWIVYFDEFNEDEEFVIEHAEEIENRLWEREEIAEVYISDESFNMTFWLQYLEMEEIESLDQSENTNLNDLQINENEFGGAKQRYQANIKAIQLLNDLTILDKKPTTADLEVLAKYVGWGGIPQVFDEKNSSWKKEYEELKKLLSIDDYEFAKGSVLNAHYTPKEIIESIYQALIKFGVKENNKILEPSVGIGNFFGHMPKEIAKNTKLYGVELDRITGRIAKLLYPDVNIQIKGFEETNFPNDYFDIVTTNVPFGAYSVHDPIYNQYHFYIHDYFIAKSLDKVRSGGIVAIVTSKGTMDKANPSVRKYIADRAELLGAIRLPNNAFEQTAKTKVTTDILFLQKRNEKIDSNSENTNWLNLATNEQGFTMNAYFVNHSEMILGSVAEERGLYGAVDLIVKPDDRNLKEALFEAIENLPQNIYDNPNFITQQEKESIEVDYSLKPFCYKVMDNKLYMRMNDEMVELAIPNKPQDALDRIKEMIALKEELRKVLDIQVEGCSDEQLHTAQLILDLKYDTFVKKYGYFNSSTNFRLFKDDGDSALLFACENIDSVTKKITKSDVFSKRTIRPYIEIINTHDCHEALQICLNARGKVDISYIEEITNKNYDKVLEELGEAVFRNPVLVNEEDKYSGFETAENYLSGNVVKKLKIAKEINAYNENHDYEQNIKALEEVQPETLKASEISVRIGASWINLNYYKQFLVDLLKMPNWLVDGIEVRYNSFDNSYKVEAENYVKYNVSKIYNTSRASVFRLYEDALNLKSTTIYDTFEEDGKTRRVLNKIETIVAREKQNRIKEEFKNWIFDDISRREDLEKTYNQLFNQIRLPTYDGSYLKFPKMNPAIELKPHQKNAVHRIITSGNTLLHHVVGSGKTYTMCATIMKLRQYGLATKPMIVVPNHLVGQWSNEFRTLYPSAKLLVTSKEDLEKHNRQRFVSKVAMGDYDAIIIAQSSFAKIPISFDRQVNKIKEEIKKVEMTILAQDRKARGSIKNLERIKKSKETKLKQLLEKENKDNVLIFEKLGVDYLFVDEADCYKNLFLFTKMNNVSGISKTASQRASDLQLKCEYINELHGKDSGVVFATGTPISNSMTEMYTMQTYLQKRTLEELGIPFFDSWAADFGETITSLELAPSGQGYKAKTRFAKFTNLPELLTLYRSFADVQTSEMVKLDVPSAIRKVIALKPSENVVELTQELADRAEAISEGNVDPHIDNMLKITNDGKKIALDPRCYDSAILESEESKLNVCANYVYDTWEKSQYVKGTQLIFCDLSTPKKDFEEYEQGKDFDVYNELKFKLVQKGIPKDEIAFIHDAKNDVQKQNLFNQVNDGLVRVLIGSTEKCGAGTNVQKHLVALYHLDTPYRPRDLQQRDGRIVRQGNLNQEVTIYTFVTERTFDSYSYQILENKQRFISQIDRGDLTVRVADDIDETTLSYAEIKAITASNPKIKRKMEVDTEISKLRILESQYKKNLYELQDKIRHELPQRLKQQDIYIEKVEKDILHLKESYDKENFSIQVLGKVYTDKKEGSNALLEAIHLSKGKEVIGEYGGFKISPDPIQMYFDREITLSNEGSYSLTIGSSAIGNITRLDNFLEDFPNRKERAIRRKEQLIAELKEAQIEVEKPFEFLEKLKELIQEQIEINIELDLNKKEEVIISEEEEMEIQKNIQSQEEKKKEEILLLKENVKKRIKDQFLKYRENELAKSSENIFNNSYQNYFFQEISEFLRNNNNGLDDIYYKALDLDGENILHYLYDYYLKNEYASINNYNDMCEFIFDYTKKYHANILEVEDDKEENMQEEKKKYLRITLPEEAVIQKYENHTFLKMPETSKYKGYTYNVYNNLLKNSRRLVDLQSEGWELCLAMNIAEDSTIVIKKGTEEITLTATQFSNIVNGTNKEEYKVEKNWFYINLPKKALITKYDESALFSMPKPYQDFSFYIPLKLINETEKNENIQLMLPKEFTIQIKNYQKKESKELNVTEFKQIFEQIKKEDYDYEIKKPSLTNLFNEIESKLVLNIPKQMKEKPNWCVLRTKKNEEKGKLEKFIIDCHTGKFAKSDDPSTWTTFDEARKYAKENGGVALVYALDGNDEIACIDLDHCIYEEKKMTDLAIEIINKNEDGYCEKSISGKGLHFLGKTKGMNLRSFSKNGDLEFYQKNHFIALTGNLLSKTNQLSNFDSSKIKNLLEKKLEKRPNSLGGIGKGIEGLSQISDKEVIERAISSKKGEVFKALYEGKDLQNNHSNSDMSLMNRLAFWCNGDREQMIRIFATSGLYRENKSTEYYEYTATKAIETISDRFGLITNKKQENKKTFTKQNIEFEKE